MILVIIFIPQKWVDKTAIIFAIIAIAVSVVGVWVVIPGHLKDIKSSILSSP